MPCRAFEVPARVWKPTSTRARMRRGLLDDVGQDTGAGWGVELDHSGEQVLEPCDGVDVVGGWVDAEDDVAAAVGEAFEDEKGISPSSSPGLLGWNPEPEGIGGADADAASGERIEDRRVPRWRADRCS